MSLRNNWSRFGTSRKLLVIDEVDEFEKWLDKDWQFKKNTSCKWRGCVWEIIGWGLGLQKNYDLQMNWMEFEKQLVEVWNIRKITSYKKTWRVWEISG